MHLRAILKTRVFVLLPVLRRENLVPKDLLVQVWRYIIPVDTGILIVQCIRRFILKYEGHLESKENFAIKKYLLIIGKLVKVLCYKSEGRWFDPRWFHWNFSLT